jgi:FMN hydrolase / 5-amino-6-(5-phospho-D-ribitylamino)uracil phosphatase
MIEVVAFDADDTLLDFQTSMWSSLQAVLPQVRALTPAAAALTVEDLDADWDLVWHRHARNLRDVRRDAFAISLARVGVTDAAVIDGVAKAYSAHRALSTRAYPDVVPMLRALGQTYRLGYATNGNFDPAHAGLAGIFAFEVYAHVDGLLPKPSREFFSRVVERSGVAADEIVYVGDNWRNDVVAAVEAGIHAIWLNRTAQTRPSGHPHITEITTLADLPAAIPT